MLLTGIAGNICILFRANDAYMRELGIDVPADCIASSTNEHVRQIQTVLKRNLSVSTGLAFRAATSGTTGGER